MNLGDMRADVRDIVGELVEDFWTDAFINRKLNAGLTQFLSEERWPWLVRIQTDVALAASANEIELVDNVDFTRQFNIAVKPAAASDGDDTSLYILQRVDQLRGLKLRQRFSSAGVPQFYYVARTAQNDYEDATYAPAAVVRVVPRADQDYQVEFTFYEAPVRLVADGEEPNIPEQYRRAVVHWAAGECWMKELQDQSKASEQFALYSRVLAAARSETNRLSMDSGLAWGREFPEWAPQLSVMESDPWTPQTLGP